MNIQSYIDRKREAGKREHEGNKTDWAGWEQPQFWAAIAGELLDAVAYAQQAAKVSTLARGVDFNESISCEICQILNRFLPKIIEAACQEAEQEAKPAEAMCEMVITKSNDPVYPTTAIIKNWKDGCLSETIIPLLGWSISFDLRAKDQHSPFIAKGATIKLSGVDDEAEVKPTDCFAGIDEFIKNQAAQETENDISD